MKILVLYYSYEGTTKKIAEAIAKKLNADIERLKVIDEPKKTGFGKFMWGGSQVVMKKVPKIEDLKHNLENYDLIIMGTPVWAGSFVPAFRTLFQTEHFAGKKTAFFYTYMGKAGHTKENMEKELTQSSILGNLAFPATISNTEKALTVAATWSSSLL